MSRAQKMFNPPAKKPILPDKKNFDGFPAFSVSVYEQYTQMVMVNTIGNTFYMNSNELFDYSISMHEKMLKTDPGFMAKAIVYARNKGLMRMQPIVGLAYLSTCPDKSYFKSAFQGVIKTPGDLSDFISVIGSVRNGKGLGRSIKTAVNDWLVSNGSKKEGLSEYHAIKYGGGNGDQKWSLKDIIKMSHPQPKSDRQSWLFKYLTQGVLNESLEQIAAIEQLKRVAQNRKEMSDAQFTARVNELIDAGRLPYETVTGIVKPTTEIWEHLMQQMPIFALVRHLNTLEGAGVFSKKANVDWVCGQLKNPDIIQKSRMLPFRFSTAHKAFNGNLQVKNALATALDLSLANASVLPGKNAIYLDVSGSMSAEYLEIGSLLGLAAVKKSQDSSFLFFDDNLGRPAINPDDTVMTNMRACQNAFTHGCTETDLCIKHLLGTAGIRGYNSRFPASEKNNAPVKVDNILIFTDEQQNSGTPVVNRFKEYRQKVNKNAKLFIVDIAPYNHRMANQDEPGVTFIYGWSETVLDVIRYSMEGSGSHVDQIKLMK